MRLLMIYIKYVNLNRKNWIYYYFTLTDLNKLIWLNYIKEGFLLDQLWKLLLNNFILYWIINGAQFFNFTWINRLIFTFYYNNIFLIIYFNTIELIQYSLTLLFWKLGILCYSGLILINILYYWI